MEMQIGTGIKMERWGKRKEEQKEILTNIVKMENKFLVESCISRGMF